MIRILSMSFLTFCFQACQDHTPADTTAKELMDLEMLAITREFQNDTAFLSSLMDSTFIELNNGMIRNKHDVLRTIYQDNIDRIKESIVRDSFKLEEPVVHVYGDAAVVSFIIHTYNKKTDSTFERKTRFYDVWVKRGKNWKAVTWQGTPVDSIH